MAPLKRARRTHIFPKAKDGWYCEPEWVSRRLFEVESFSETVLDPACGCGTILRTAHLAGKEAYGSDIKRRAGVPKWARFERQNFLHSTFRLKSMSVVCNPPFDHVEDFARHALALGADKVALIFLVRRLPAAHWLQELPLARVWLLSPRPSMPPGEWIKAGNTPGGGSQDFCWIIITGFKGGPPELRWLHRDKILTGAGV